MQIEDKAAEFERGHADALPRNFIAALSYRLHDGKGSEIPLTSILSARQQKDLRDSAARRHKIVKGEKWQGIERDT